MELAHSSEGYPIPALSPVDEAGLIFLPPPTQPRPSRRVTITLRS
jgi:hypothetical protein